MAQGKKDAIRRQKYSHHRRLVALARHFNDRFKPFTHRACPPQRPVSR
jgi:hypothetical protein